MKKIKKIKKVGILQRLKNIEDNISPRNENAGDENAGDENAGDENAEDENKEEEVEPEELVIIRNSILNRYDINKLISRSRSTNPDMPSVIDGRDVYNAYVDLRLNRINQDQYNQVFNIFNNKIDRMIRVRGNNLGSVQNICLNLRNDLVNDQNNQEGRSFKKSKRLGPAVKILTPNQMLALLPIPLAQIQAGNNSQKLKNEIRQLLYSLYRSKKINKSIYKKLIDTIKNL